MTQLSVGRRQYGACHSPPTPIRAVVTSLPLPPPDDLLKDLMKAMYPCMALHGGIDQFDRDSTINDFKSGKINLLVGTPTVTAQIIQPSYHPKRITLALSQKLCQPSIQRVMPSLTMTMNDTATLTTSLTMTMTPRL